ncbi:MAG TPA: CBS domain-containing protein, partial [Membranihabitans sp.]|nr:CBS domain-containing protein [Membranihabitans sp.]
QLQDRLNEGDVVVMILHDHGSRYINKVYNDNWMMERGFLSRGKNIRHVLESKGSPNLITTSPEATLRSVLEQITENGISQLPVFENDEPVGSINETDILNHVVGDPDRLDNLVKSIMQGPFPVVDVERPVSEVSKLLSRSNTAVLSRDRSGNYQIITSFDLLKNLNH